MVCDRSDGMAICAAKARPVCPIIVLSTEANPVVQKRADKLDIPCIQGQTDKGTALQQWMEEFRLTRRGSYTWAMIINDIALHGACRMPGGCDDRCQTGRFCPSPVWCSKHPGGSARRFEKFAQSYTEKEYHMPETIKIGNYQVGPGYPVFHYR